MDLKVYEFTFFNSQLLIFNCAGRQIIRKGPCTTGAPGVRGPQCPEWIPYFPKDPRAYKLPIAAIILSASVC